MNDGQPVQSNPSGQPANGSVDTERVFDTENNLGIDNWGQTPGQDTRKLGREAITSLDGPEKNTLEAEEVSNEKSSQFFGPTMPPGYPQIEETSSNNEEPTPIPGGNIISFSKIKTDFEKGNIGPAEFAKTVNEAREEYLHAFNGDPGKGRAA